MKARNENLLGRLQKLPPATAITSALLYLTVVGVADFYLPVGMRFTLLYVLGVAFIAWCTDPWLALAGAALTSGVSMGVELTSAHPNYATYITVWNESTRSLLFIATGWLIARAGNFARRLSELVAERTADLRAEADQHKATATALAETVERFEQVVNNIAEVFWLSDVPKNQVIYVSPGYERIWGRKCDELYREPRSWVAALHPDDREQVNRLSLTEQVTGGYDVEYRILRPDGAVRWIRDRAFPVRNPKGEVYRIAGIAEDITSQKRAREVLETQAAILENMAEAAVLTDDQGNIVLTNATLDRRLGYEQGELVGKPMTVMAGVSAEKHERVFNAAVAAVKARGYIAGEYLARRKDGSTVEVEARGSGVIIGGRFGLVVVAQDITERKRAEQALRQSEETLRSFLQALPEPAMLLDRKGLLLLGNQALARNLGLPENAMVGKCVFDSFPTQVASKRRAMIEQVIASAKAVQFADVRGDRAFVSWASPVLDSAGAVSRVAVIAFDVTARQRAEAALLQSEETLRAFVQAMPEPAVLLDREGMILLSNQVFARRLGIPERELTGKHAFSLLAPGLAETRKAVFDHVLLTRQQARTEDSREGRHFVNFTCPVLDAAGNVRRIAVFAMDITERKQAEEALRRAHATLELRVRQRTAELQAINQALSESEARLRLALDASNAGTWSWDAATNTSEWDDRYHTLYGFEPHAARSFDTWIKGVLPQDRERLQARIRALLEPGGDDLWNEEFRALHPAKGERWMAGLGRIERDQAGRAVRLAGINLDITQRKRAEEAQRAQLAQILAIYQSAPIGLCLVDLNFRYLRINERLAAINGLPVDEHLGRTVREAAPQMADRIEALCRQAVATGQPVLNVELEGTTEAQPGVIRSWVTHWVPLKEPDGRVTNVNIFVEEITERKAMHRALQESEQKYRRLFASMTDAYASTDMSGRLTAFNPAFQALLGYRAEELRDLTYVDLTPTTWHALDARILAEQVLPQGYSEVYEKEYRRKDGTIFPIELRTFLLRGADDQPAGMWAIVRDITRRKQAEAALREAHEMLEARVKERTAELEAANAALAESEERYRSLVTNLNVGVYRNTTGSNGRFLHANPALARIHGCDSVEEFQTFMVSETYQEPGERKEYLAELLRRGSVANYEVHLKKKDGTPIDCAVNATVHRRADGEVDWIDGVLEDITERKQAQEALRASEERYRTLAESSPDAIFIIDREIRVQYVNPTAAALWQRRPKDLIGLKQTDLFPVEIAQRQSDVISAVLESGSIVRRERPITFPIGDQWLEVRLAPLLDARGGVASVMGIARNITERKRAEQQLAETLDLNQKMIAASAMGIAAYKASGECVFANDALARIVGGSPSDVLQGNFRRLPDWQESGMLRQADEALGQGQTRSMEILGITRFGKSISLDCHVAPFISNGQPHLLVMAMDISERKRAEEALRMQSLILQNMAEGTLLTSPDQTILFANSALEAMFGYEPGELVGKPVSVLNAWSPEETARFNHAVMRATEAGKLWHGQYQNRRKDGTLFTSESRVIRLALGGQDHFISVQQDITERRRAESLLQAQRDVGVSLSLTSDLTIALKGFLEIAVQIGGLDCGGVYLLNQVTQELDLAAHLGLSGSFVQAVAHYAADSPHTKLVLQGQALFDTYQNLPVHHSATKLREGLRATAIVPLSHNQRIIGLLSMASHTAKEIPAQTRIVIEAIAAQASGAIARIRSETERHRLERQLLEISDREHARIGQDIHDGLCQHLVSLGFDANSLQQALGAAHRPEAKRARRIADYLDQAITEARQLSRGLFPVRLAREGLPPALEELAAATQGRFKIQCRFASEGQVTVENGVTATHLYRIAQEAVSNAVKHSRASSVAIRLCARAGMLELSVTDDGVGLPHATRNTHQGMGLHIMDYRARSIGGTLQISPGRLRGTEVSCCVPVPARGDSPI